MTYTSLTRASVGDMFTEPNYEQIRENFAQSLPDRYTAKGQLSAGVGGSALGEVQATADRTALVANTGSANGVDFAGGVPPIGSIILWSGSSASIPSGWALCNGSSGTPDLRGRFVVGAGGAYAVGASGGGINLRHAHAYGYTTAPDDFIHNHSQGPTGSAGHTHTVPATTTGAASASVARTVASGQSIATGDHTHNIASPTGNASHTHTMPDNNSTTTSHQHMFNALPNALLTEYLPPYYALCYIMRLT